MLREFDSINPGLTSVYFFSPTAAEGKFWPRCADGVKNITSGLLENVGVSSHSKLLFLLLFPWPNGDLSIGSRVLQRSVVNRFAHYIVKRGMYKSEEGKDGIDGLIISTKTGRKNSLICKNTVCLELNSEKFVLWFTFSSSMVSQVKVWFFFRNIHKKYLDSMTICPWLLKEGGVMENNLVGTMDFYGT